MSIPASAFCELLILDADGRVRRCGGLAVTTRTVNGKRRLPLRGMRSLSRQGRGPAREADQASAHTRAPEVPMSAARDDGHCHGPECFKDDGAPVDVCACECHACAEAREQLLLEQGEGDEPDNGARPAADRRPRIDLIQQAESRDRRPP